MFFFLSLLPTVPPPAALSSLIRLPTLLDTDSFGGLAGLSAPTLTSKLGSTRCTRLDNEADAGVDVGALAGMGLDALFRIPRAPPAVPVPAPALVPSVTLVAEVAAAVLVVGVVGHFGGVEETATFGVGASFSVVVVVVAAEADPVAVATAGATAVLVSHQLKIDCIIDTLGAGAGAGVGTGAVAVAVAVVAVHERSPAGLWLTTDDLAFSTRMPPPSPPPSPTPTPLALSSLLLERDVGGEDAVSAKDPLRNPPSLFCTKNIVNIYTMS
jgi:hypothetical protein